MVENLKMDGFGISLCLIGGVGRILWVWGCFLDKVKNLFGCDVLVMGFRVGILLGSVVVVVFFGILFEFEVVQVAVYFFYVVNFCISVGILEVSICKLKGIVQVFFVFSDQKVFLKVFFVFLQVNGVEVIDNCIVYVQVIKINFVYFCYFFVKVLVEVFELEKDKFFF